MSDKQLFYPVTPWTKRLLQYTSEYWVYPDFTPAKKPPFYIFSFSEGQLCTPGAEDRKLAEAYAATIHALGGKVATESRQLLVIEPVHFAIGDHSELFADKQQACIALAYDVMYSDCMRWVYNIEIDAFPLVHAEQRGNDLFFVVEC